MNPALRGFAKALEISPGRAASHEISDTSHFWLGQKYHKNNAASSLSALAALPTLPAWIIPASIPRAPRASLGRSPQHPGLPAAPSLPSRPMRRAGRYFWPRNQMSHLWIRRTISGGEGGAVPGRRLQRLLQQPRLGGCRRDIALPACPVSPDLEPPTAREVVQSHCTHFSSVLTLSALRPGLLYRGSLLGALTNRQETKSFAVRTHCLPGANFEQKKKKQHTKKLIYFFYL